MAAGRRTMSASPKIAIRNLTKSFVGHDGSKTRNPILRGIDIDIADGEFVCILGASGCGKSTLLNIIAALDRQDGGEVLIGGKPVDGDSARIGYLFQEDRLLPWRNAEQNIDFALRAARVPRAAWAARKDRYLAIAGLSDCKRYFPHQLSGGMRQRLALVRALSIEPDILLMDEPFSGLDELTARRLRVDILDIWRETKRTIIFVTHNSYEASFLADRIVIMAAGKIREVIPVDIPRPRDYDDTGVFELNRRVVRRFIDVTNEGRAADALDLPETDRQQFNPAAASRSPAA
jgi:NitT/TauT family transport system ATP-binding protein